MAKLTPKQERFVAEYLVELNAKKAAIQAGYSAKTAEQQGYQLLQHPLVSEAIKNARTKLSIRTGVTQDDVIEGLKKEAQNEGEGSSAAARVSAWNLLGKHLGMFKEKIEHSGTVSIASLIENSFGKAEDK